MSGTRLARQLIVVSLIVGSVILPRVAAEAGVGCLFSNNAVTVTLTARDDSVDIGRSPQGAIEIYELDAYGTRLGDGRCGGAQPTVFDTDLIHVITQHDAGEVSVQISTRNGGLAPGASSEAIGVPEIEIQLEFARTDGYESVGIYGGSETVSDTIVLGTNGAAFNRDNDTDITFDEFQLNGIWAQGISGDDLLSGAGGFGTGAATARRVSFYGGAGDDVLEAGTSYAILYGGEGSDVLRGSSGNDILLGGAGGDVLDGGTGNDRSVYGATVEGVQVNLAAATSTGGEASGDSILNVENLDGTRYPDRLTGDAGPNRLIGGVGYDYLYGLEGDDFFVGGAHEPQPTYFPFDIPGDVIDGGLGRDTSNYGDSRYPVRVNLATGEATGGSAQGDQLQAIEDVQGSPSADILIGDVNQNRLLGGAGDDRLQGASAEDELSGELGADVILGGEGDDRELGGDGNDRLLQDASPNGADILSGGGGDDEVNYAERTSPVVYSRDNQPNDGEPGERDNVLSDVERVYGATEVAPQPSPTPTASASPSPTPSSGSPSPSTSPSITTDPSVTPSPDLSPSATPSPTATPSADPSATPSPSPTGSPVPVPNHDRTVSLSLRRHLVAHGRVTMIADDDPGCTSGVQVRVQKFRAGRWRTVVKTEAGLYGAYRTRLPDRGGYYRAKVVSEAADGPESCETARSPSRRHQH